MLGSHGDDWLAWVSNIDIDCSSLSVLLALDVDLGSVLLGGIGWAFSSTCISELQFFNIIFLLNSAGRDIRGTASRKSCALVSMDSGSEDVLISLAEWAEIAEVPLVSYASDGVGVWSLLVHLLDVVESRISVNIATESLAFLHELIFVIESRSKADKGQGSSSSTCEHF